MIIQSIQVENLGPFRESVEIGPMQQDMHVLAANNEEGKTTMIKAAIRCLFDKHTCKDSEIKALQPAGSDLAPKVTVCFEHDEKSYKITKRFINQPTSDFYELHDGDWQRVADGDAADKRVFALLESQQPGKGATKPAHWGLMQYLWAMQGEPVSWPAWDGVAGEMVKSQLAKVEIDPVTEELSQNVQEVSGRYFTPGGKSKKGGTLKSDLDLLEKLQSELSDVRNQMEEVEAKENRYQSLTPKIDRLESEHKESIKTATELREKASKAESVTKELDDLGKNLQVAESKLNEIRGDRENLEKLEKSTKTKQQTLADKQSESQSSQDSKVKLSSELSKLKDAKVEVQQHLKKLETGVDRTESILQYRRKQQDLSTLEKQYYKARDSHATFKASQKALEALPSITSGKLKKLEDLERSVREKEIQLQSTGLTIEFDPDQACEGKAELDGESRAFKFKKREKQTIHAAQTALIKLPNWGDITIRSGAEEVSSLIESLETENKEWKACLGELGVSDIDEARDILQKRDGLKSTVREQEKIFENSLDDWEDLESLESSVNTTKQQCALADKELAVDEEESQLSMADIEAQLQKQKVTLKSKQAELAETEKQIAACQSRLDETNAKCHQSEKEVAQIQSEISSEQQRIKDINGRYPKAMEASLKEAQSEFVKAEARLEEKRKELPVDHAALPERNRRAAAAEAEIKEELDKTKRDITLLEGELKALGGAGLYSQETRLLESIQQAESRVKVSQTDGIAARLVQAMIEFRKNQATQTVLAPLEERLSNQFAMLTGQSDRKVFLDDQLCITGIGRESATIPFDSLSQGAREQLVLSLRLAVAEELSAEGSAQCLILDDVLVNSDKERQERIMDALSAAKDRIQILLLTCHPEWYRGLGTPVHFKKV